ncbi:hypothetical protein GMOD_00004778 [Pyrenophora seminiperda CCB06]|uniref:Probable double zinc ribbon domain-containing protein n=1 Tax=Pyrenophora seminiperda CCB06 TaxID=1302712 RepID=A0A3M7MI02_9PLEO|nr:hypothetical protein GMOD_00004778 [Pyrenophora seminiperda CCB06]
MSQPPYLYNSNYSDDAREPTKETRPESTKSLIKPKKKNHTVMNLPNVSIGTIGEFARGGDCGEPTSYAAVSQGSAQGDRYGNQMHSVDMMEDSYKDARFGLTQKLPGSITRARAVAEMRLQNSMATLRSPQGRSNALATPEASLDGAAVFLTVPTIKFTDDENKPEEKGEPCGKWRCCKCQRGQELVSYTKGKHPVNVLECECVHRSCAKCTLEGLIKPFVPMSEPEVVPVSEDSSKTIRFGVFCDCCGVSWRAQEVHDDTKKKAAVKSALLRVSALPRRLNLRKAHPLERLRHSRSLTDLHAQPRPAALLTASRSVLNLRVLSSEMEKEHGQQAEMVTVKFAGITCECGMVTDATSLCFQIVDPPKDFYKAQFAKLMAERKATPPSFGTTPEDQARGHGTPILTLKGGRIRHINPLRANPV